MRKLISLVCCLCFLIGAATCFSAPKPIPNEIRLTKGTLRIGEKVDQALKMLGNPVYIAASENYCWRNRLNLYGPEFIVKALPKGNKIYGFVVRKQAGITTPEGIGVGSTKEAIIAQYGEAREFSRGKHLFMVYGKDGKYPYIRFMLSKKTNKVEAFSMGVPPSYGKR